MNKSDEFHRIWGVVFIVVGILFYFTPMPGTTFLIILGLVWLIGKNRTFNFVKKVLGEKIFNYLKIGSLINKSE